MDDDGDDDPVPLPNVNAAILKKVSDSEDTQTKTYSTSPRHFIKLYKHSSAPVKYVPSHPNPNPSFYFGTLGLFVLLYQAQTKNVLCAASVVFTPVSRR